LNSDWYKRLCERRISLQSFKNSKGGRSGCAFIDVRKRSLQRHVRNSKTGNPRGFRSGFCKVKLHVLGCAGGIGGRQRHTTCLWLDDDILLDAGTGITSLDLVQLAGINHVFLTHSHLDHIAGLALLVDTVLGKRAEPVTVHASEQVIDALKEHLFNWALWPDFAAIPSVDNPVLRWAPFKPGETIDIKGRTIVTYPVNHTAGSVAYLAHQGNRGFLFTGDMCSTPSLWAAVAAEKRMSKVVVDCSFPNSELELASRSKHFCPQTLLADIGAMADSIEFLIYHLKPGQEDLIMAQLNAAGSRRTFKALACGDVFVF
jgi:glyoxylase-like metal-dependent hydrolase (beta-lactamase superfamily II)